MEGTHIQPAGGRRLVLGFDTECMTCSGLAKDIDEAIGGRLEVRSPSDSTMEHWRRCVFGEDAPGRQSWLRSAVATFRHGPVGGWRHTWPASLGPPRHGE